MFSAMRSKNALKVKTKVRDYFADLTSKANAKTICCFSDITESCFGKYKEMLRGNKTVGITDLFLSIMAMMGIKDAEMSDQAMGKI
jgi:hypothetical protein